MASLCIAKGTSGVNKVYTMIKHKPAICVFFTGDRVDDFDADPEIHRLQEPSVVSSIISSKFPSADIAVILPSRFEANFACYDHFLGKCTITGEPLGYHGSTFTASKQLVSLLQSCQLWNDQPEEAGPPSRPVYIVGFSKAAAVLNQKPTSNKLQLVAEIAVLGENSRGTPSDTQHAQLLRQIEQMHYLDAGLNCRGSYTTDPTVIKNLTTKVELVLHGTPRQWSDARRPWLAVEKNLMKKLCQEYGIVCREEVYFEGEKPSMLMHFKVIEAMKTAWSHGF